MTGRIYIQDQPRVKYEVGYQHECQDQYQHECRVHNAARESVLVPTRVLIVDSRHKCFTQGWSCIYYTFKHLEQFISDITL